MPPIFQSQKMSKIYYLKIAWIAAPSQRTSWFWGCSFWDGHAKVILVCCDKFALFFVSAIGSLKPSRSLNRKFPKTFCGLSSSRVWNKSHLFFSGLVRLHRRDWKKLDPTDLVRNKHLQEVPWSLESQGSAVSVAESTASSEAVVAWVSCMASAYAHGVRGRGNQCIGNVKL